MASETLTSIKKLSNKIISLSRKIEESENSGLKNKSFAYFEQMIKCQDMLAKAIDKLKTEI